MLFLLLIKSLYFTESEEKTKYYDGKIHDVSNFKNIFEQKLSVNLK